MFILEQLHIDQTRELLVTPDQKAAAKLLQQVLKLRSRELKREPASEHLRAAMYRLRRGQTVDNIVTLTGEQFRIRFSESAQLASPRGRYARYRLLRSLRSTSTVDTNSSDGADSVYSEMNSAEPDDDAAGALIDGERFDLGDQRP